MKPNNMYMNMKQHIQTLVLTALLFLAGGMMNYVTAKKVTYHILTKPFDVQNHNATGYKWQNIRVEALQCFSEEATIGLPDQFKSPLAKNFRYWASATATYDHLYDYTNNSNLISAKYYIYQCTDGNAYACLSTELTVGDPVDSYTDIYVTYDYVNDGEESGFKNGIMELDGGTHYNISINVSGNLKYMCLNRSRNNRVSNANASALTAEQLSDNDFVVPENGNKELGWPWGSGDNKIYGPKGIHLGFKFFGEDPYNLTIMTSYTGNEVHVTDAITGDSPSGASIKPFAGATLFGKMGNDQMWFDASNDRHYKIKSSMSNGDVDLTTGNYKNPAKYEEKKALYINSGDKYDSWVGYYRKETDTELNTYALLSHPNDDKSYLFVASKMNMGNKTSTKPTINQPTNDSKYYIYNDGASNKPNFKDKKLLSAAYTTKLYEIKTYTVNVKTHGSGTTLTTTMKWSDAMLSENPANHIPDALKRKYVTYSAYKDAALTQPMTTFAEAAANSYVIYLGYTVSESLPFDTLAATSGTYDYRNARWYTMRMNGTAEQKNIAYNSSNNFITGSTSIGSNSDLHTGEDQGAKIQVAFVGDPYELKIISREASETAIATRYVGCATDATDGTTLNTNKTGSSDISTWEIVYENSDFERFELRQYGTYASPKYVGWGSTGDHPVTYSSTASRIRVVELKKVSYTYHIVRNNGGDIAVKATESQDIGTMLRTWTDIPEIIRSPFLETATVTYYDDVDKAKAKTPTISNAPYSLSGGDIYVRYDVSLSAHDYNVIVNNRYIYTDEDAGDATIYTKESITTGESENAYFQWTLDYSDPYHMTIKNKGKDKYVNVAFSGGASITWSDTPSYFVAKSGAIAGTFEAMAATGNGVESSTTYYNIGRPADNTVKLYSNGSYVHGNQTLRFQLIGTSATEVHYHLIDKAGKDLLQAITRQTDTDPVNFPPEFRSPLVSTYHYFIESNFAIDGDTYTLKPAQSELATVGSNGHIYVTYDVNNLVDLQRGQLYLLKYEAGENFRQEDGGDNLLPQVADMSENTYRYKAVYPYVNGDCNFFVYGQEQYDIQQQGAASTRTRWAWYVQSDLGDKGDPYHVKIRSRQSESYPITDSKEYNAFWATYKPADYDKAVTTLVWPGISGETATDYMVLGSEGQYQLMTSYKVDMNRDGDTDDVGDERKVVNSFEQYWKTFDTIRKNIYGDSKASAKDEDPITIPNDTPSKYGSTTYTKTLRDSLTNVLGWHHYEKWAYGKRWNGYNNGYSSTEGKHEAKKGWEEIEHWYQTVNMGEGYFDFVKTSIDPVMILLDQHGWEIMRKPIPTSDDDPEKDAKLEAIRPYNSPMVKEYAFWATTKKRTGFHQYYLLSDRMGDGKGGDHTSTDLTDLPPFNGKNVFDKKGNQYDQYVTYIVKDEYAQTYNPADKTSKPFVIEQGTKYASTSDGSTITKNDVPGGGMLDYITNNSITDDKKWYIKPNWNIDYEMGYGDTGHSWPAKNPNAYEDARYKNLRTAKYISNKDSLGYFSFSNGFDPYNIQIMPINYSTGTRKFMKTNATGMNLDDGIMHGVYEDGDPAIEIGDSIPVVDKNNSVWFDSRKLSITNTTFMAVQDAEGNMQLMPRFDQDVRMSEFGTLIAPTDANVSKTYTKLYRPVVYEYRIIDNSGHESLRYKSGGDMLPQTPDHFKSPLAMNFTYYASADKEGDIYDVDNEIDGSLDGASLTNDIVYVRYEYDEEADNLGILKGNWLTMQMYANGNWKYVQYGNTASSFMTEGMYPEGDGDTKPTTVDGDDRIWQWKFLETPQSDPDPYAVQIFNRDKLGLPMSSSSNNGHLTANSSNTYKYFALLNHSSGDYAMTLARTNSYSSYYFMHGGSTMQYVDGETAKLYAGTTPTMEAADQIKLFDEVQHTFTYKVYTNGGVNAVDATQTQDEVTNNGWKPVLPEAARTPLLNLDQYRYYEQSLTPAAVAENDTTGMALPFLYGLYEDVVYTHYTPYNDKVSTYAVPNVRNDTSADPVARGALSNDAPIGIDGTRPYNIFWYQDSIMKSSGSTIIAEKDQTLQDGAAYEWEFTGNDPYAINIKSVGSEGKFISEATSTTTVLSETPTPFMLLNKDGYDYGVFTVTGSAITGQTPVMLSRYGNLLTTSNPTKFIPFALSTYMVIYHLMIKNIGENVVIQYRNEGESADKIKPTKIKSGTTARDLKSRDTSGGVENHIDGDKYQLGSSLNTIIGGKGLGARDSIYCVNAGHVSLGAALEVPQAFYRPNVTYDFYIEGIYANDGTGGTGDLEEDITALNDEYKGLKMTNMGEDSKLLGKIVFVNIVYNFMGGLATNSGSDFVESVSQNKWYTFETSGATPYRAHFTATNGLKTESASNIQYTNDFLWTPVGDPYGFKMYNRYIDKNMGNDSVMCTSDISAGPIVMTQDDSEHIYSPANSVYELLANTSTTPGYFRVHPVVNKNELGVSQYYINNNTSTGAMTLSTTPTEWTFGLSEEMLQPYRDRAGYVGGLTTAGKTAYDNAEGEGMAKLMNRQAIVYDDDNIVSYSAGYYRIHSQPNAGGLTTPRYASGYTHKIELTPGTGTELAPVAIPMHFYEQTEYDIDDPVFGDLDSRSPAVDFTETNATRGEVPITTVDEDPASIFRFIGAASAAKMSTQGLYVVGNSTTHAAEMTEPAGSATDFKIEDIGGATMLIYTQPGALNTRTYLNWDQTSKKYDLKYSVPSEPAYDRWCMQPVQKGTKAGAGEMALRVRTHDDGNAIRYTTFYAPFDVLLTNATTDMAYIVPTDQLDEDFTADTQYTIHPKRMGDEGVNTGTYAGNNQFIPAGTPAIIRTKATSGYVTLALPTTTPTSSVSCVFTGKHLEQMLDQGSDYVFVFGRPSSGTFTEDASFSTNGLITVSAPASDRGVGFYKNANLNRESSKDDAEWTRNNKYVYGNKIYYRADVSSGGGSSALDLAFEKSDYIPVIFDEDELELQDDDNGNGATFGDGRIYDLQGRCVVTEQEVLDGSWINNVAPGIYILNGKKIAVK
ncbi:MAG: hypothetical protein IJ782_07320 [Prevotella sp.]|nr:hypothetical protein [Prevotella sp.]